MEYETAKILHIFGAVLFMGNIIVTAFWKFFSDRTKDPLVIAFSQRMVGLTDWVFTFPGVVLVYTSSQYLLPYAGATDFSPSWVAWGHSMFIITGAIWILILLPVQVKLSRLAKTFAQGEAIPPRYWFWERVWMVFGSVATILPLAILYFMIYKPV